MEALQKIHLTEVKETLLITLYSRALDFRRKSSLLHDEKADELIRRIDYDFPGMGITSRDSYAISVRARHFDDWTRDFVAHHPDAVVVQLACGLDSRASRVPLPPKVDWFDVDFPEVIEIRRRFFSESESYKMIASSVTDTGWLAAIPKDRPTLILAEGLFMYLNASDVRAVLGQLTSHFPKGEICFDVLSSVAGKWVRYKRSFAATGAVFRWTADDPRAVTRMNGRLIFLEEANPLDSPYLSNTSLRYRVMSAALRRIPSFRKAFRLFRFRF